MEDVLNVMQLVDVQHSLVGNVELRGISGGQRKRVNIGISVEHVPCILKLKETFLRKDMKGLQERLQQFA